MGADGDGEIIGWNERTESDGVRGTGSAGKSKEETDIKLIMACDWLSMRVVASSMAAVGSGWAEGVGE